MSIAKSIYECVGDLNKMIPPKEEINNDINNEINNNEENKNEENNKKEEINNNINNNNNNEKNKNELENETREKKMKKMSINYQKRKRFHFFQIRNIIYPNIFQEIYFILI